MLLWLLHFVVHCFGCAVLSWTLQSVSNMKIVGYYLTASFHICIDVIITLKF
jgi:hypothetical protein